MPLCPRLGGFSFHVCVMITQGFCVEWFLSNVIRHSPHCDQDSKSAHNQTNYAHREPAETACL